MTLLLLSWRECLSFPPPRIFFLRLAYASYVLVEAPAGPCVSRGRPLRLRYDCTERTGVCGCRRCSTTTDGWVEERARGVRNDGEKIVVVVHSSFCCPTRRSTARVYHLEPTVAQAQNFFRYPTIYPKDLSNGHDVCARGGAAVAFP